jgi:hypothetical protein
MLASTSQSPTTREPWGQRHVPALLVVLFGGLILLLASAEEPYHIDELRQTRQYGNSFEAVIQESRGQEQPPLDPLLNAAVQRIIGIGDVRQRLLSVAFGIGSLLTVWGLGRRSAMQSRGLVVTVGVMAFTPALISVTAYARPYALPLFLMLVFLLLSDIWLASERSWVVPIMVITALALPWTRTVEPVIFLALMVIVAGIRAIRSRAELRRTMVLGSIAAAGLVSSVPALFFVSDEIADRTPDASGIWDRVGRIFTEIPQTFADAIPYWPLVIIALLLVLILPTGRRMLLAAWWWWVMAATAIGFAFAFSLVAPLGQPFYERYVFTWVPPTAVLLGIMVSASYDSSRGAWRRALNIAITVTASTVAVVAVTTTWIGLTSRTHSDWKAVSDVIVDDFSQDTQILFDAVTSLGSYRTPFAGFPRYTGDHAPIPNALQTIRNPESVTGGSNTAVVLLTEARYEVDGWIPVGVDRFFTVYLPESRKEGRQAAAESMAEFSEVIGLDQGAALRLASAALWVDLGDPKKASALMKPLLEDSGLSPIVRDTIESTELDQFVD